MWVHLAKDFTTWRGLRGEDTHPEEEWRLVGMREIETVAVNPCSQTLKSSFLQFFFNSTCPLLILISFPAIWTDNLWINPLWCVLPVATCTLTYQLWKLFWFIPSWGPPRFILFYFLYLTISLEIVYRFTESCKNRDPMSPSLEFSQGWHGDMLHNYTPGSKSANWHWCNPQTPLYFLFFRRILSCAYWYELEPDFCTQEIFSLMRKWSTRQSGSGVLCHTWAGTACSPHCVPANQALGIC